MLESLLGRRRSLLRVGYSTLMQSSPSTQVRTQRCEAGSAESGFLRMRVSEKAFLERSISRKPKRSHDLE